jgi:polyisoprenyl-phosphate glycosyltransferase
MKLSIVVPCYNEAANLPALLSAYAEAITRDDIEVILVDNGSTDETAQVLTELAPRYQRFLRIYTVSKNHGYGHGILSGLATARGEFIGWTHGDMQTPPQDLLQALRIIEEYGNANNLYVKGRREGRPLFDRIFTWGMNIFETIYLRTPLYEVNAQPNIFHSSFFATWKNPPIDFSFDLYVLYHAKQCKLKIIRFPVLFLERQHGSSKWNTNWQAKWRFIKRTVQFSVELKKNLK